MNYPLISVIVPIFMIDRYLGICIESIINQTYKNLEIILVDDGGNDRCPEICDLYAKKDKRIKVIHKSNGGLVSARKAGLRMSNGEYISYVDGDDWIGSGFIESMYSAAEASQADMVCAGFTRDLFSKTGHFTNALPAGLYSDNKLKSLWKSMISLGEFYKPGVSTYVWNKLFKREILLDAQYSVNDRISIGEDGAVTYHALLRCNRVVLTDNVAYHYRQREDSMLKQQADYAVEAQKLKYLYSYLLNWEKETDATLCLKSQIIDYVLSIALMRSGGRTPGDDFSIFDKIYFKKDVVVYSAGTFGQQLVNRIKEHDLCNIVAWVDDDYWEYRRCCMDVDPIDSITSLKFDYILIATVNSSIADTIIKQLLNLGIEKNKILVASISEDKESLLRRLLDIDAIKSEQKQKKREVLSHA